MAIHTGSGRIGRHLDAEVAIAIIGLLVALLTAQSPIVTAVAGGVAALFVLMRKGLRDGIVPAGLVMALALGASYFQYHTREDPERIDLRDAEKSACDAGLNVGQIAFEHTVATVKEMGPRDASNASKADPYRREVRTASERALQLTEALSTGSEIKEAVSNLYSSALSLSGSHTGEASTTQGTFIGLIDALMGLDMACQRAGFDTGGQNLESSAEMICDDFRSLQRLADRQPPTDDEKYLALATPIVSLLQKAIAQDVVGTVLSDYALGYALGLSGANLGTTAAERSEALSSAADNAIVLNHLCN